MPIILPNTFIPNTRAQAGQVNENFNTIVTFCNGLENSVNDITTDLSNTANKYGSSSNLFSVADAQTAYHAMNKRAFTGMVAFFAQTSVPGWLICNGGDVTKTTYPELFSIIGTTFGTPSDTSKFRLPLLTDQRFMRGWTSSGAYGDASNTILPAHNHSTLVFNVGTPGVSAGEGAFLLGPSATVTGTASSGGDCYPKYLQLVPMIKY